MQSFEWKEFASSDFQKLGKTRDQYHHAIQIVSLIGRRFIPEEDKNRAALNWVPGLFRLAGQWVKGETSFRSSLGFNSFTLFFVDEKGNTITSFDLNGKTYVQGMVWLEEQLAKQKLKATNLQIKLPYKIPPYPTTNGASFDVDPEMALELGKYYHNSYILIRELKQEFEIKDTIHAWAKDFDQTLTLVIKDSGDPETSSRIALGMSPGDGNFHMPYFYVSTWPFTEVEKCKKLANGALWVSDEWTGAVLKAESLFAGDQKAIANQFYHEATSQLVKLLTQ